ncbi:hypothetical protein BS17DRAFT_708843, partial [Gyrodon lividus]
ILDQISNHPIFQNQSNNKQLPIAIQLGIFLNCAGHYGNANSPKDIAQWAGVSIGMVINCTHHAMVAILDQHDEFLYIPSARSKGMWQAREFTKSQTCPSWKKKGYLQQMDQGSIYFPSLASMGRHLMIESPTAP